MGAQQGMETSLSGGGECGGRLRDAVMGGKMDSIIGKKSTLNLKFMKQILGMNHLAYWYFLEI